MIFPRSPFGQVPDDRRRDGADFVRSRVEAEEPSAGHGARAVAEFPFVKEDVTVDAAVRIGEDGAVHQGVGKFPLAPVQKGFEEGMAEGDKFNLGIPEGDLLVEGDAGIAFEGLAVGFPEGGLLGDLPDRVGDGLHAEEFVLPLPESAAGLDEGLAEPVLRVFGDEAVLPRPLRHLPDAGIVDEAGGEALAQILLDPGDVGVVDPDVQIPEDLVDVPGVGRCVHEELG